MPVPTQPSSLTHTHTCAHMRVHLHANTQPALGSPPRPDPPPPQNKAQQDRRTEPRLPACHAGCHERDERRHREQRGPSQPAAWQGRKEALGLSLRTPGTRLCGKPDAGKFLRFLHNSGAGGFAGRASSPSHAPVLPRRRPAEPPNRSLRRLLRWRSEGRRQ